MSLEIIGGCGQRGREGYREQVESREQVGLRGGSDEAGEMRRKVRQ